MAYITHQLAAKLASLLSTSADKVILSEYIVLYIGADNYEEIP